MKVVDSYRSGKMFVVVVGADDPSELDRGATATLACSYAKKRGYKKAYNVADIKCFGQNRLSTRKFTFEK
jgi:hypothetical protein